VPLATLDEKLQKAAKLAAGVKIFERAAGK
jgi:hypothetical protein